MKDRMALVAVGLLVTSVSGYGLTRQAVYDVTDLGLVLSAAQDTVTLNDRGQIVFANEQRQAKIWYQGTIQTLPNLPGASDSQPCDINNAGVVVGYSRVGVQAHAVRWDNGSVTDLDTFGGSSSVATAINDSDLVVGYYQFLQSADSRGFAIDGQNVAILPTLGGARSVAREVNRSGLIVGNSFGISGVANACYWQFTGPATALINSSLGSVAESVNNMGIIVGGRPVSANGHSRAFSYESVMVLLPELPTALRTGAYAVNELNQIVGHTTFPPTTDAAVLFEHGDVFNLNDLIDPNLGWDLLYASDINNSGWIVGLGLKQGQGRGFLLTPRTGVVRYCSTTANSSGQSASIDWTGSPTYTANDFTLIARCHLPSRSGAFFYNRTPTAVPFGNGIRCVGSGAPAAFRIGSPKMTDSSGDITQWIDLFSPPISSGAGQISAGETWYFQGFYRDTGSGSGVNLTDALAVTFDL